MDKPEFYEILDIESPAEFKYYENLAALMEVDEYIEPQLISELISDIDKASYLDMLESYMDEFLRILPDEYIDMYITVETVKRVLLSGISEEMTNEELEEYAAVIDIFRRWYVHEANVVNKTDGTGICVRDARYGLLAGTLLGEDVEYDFEKAYDFEAPGYEISLSEMIADAFDESESEYEDGSDLEMSEGVSDKSDDLYS